MKAPAAALGREEDLMRMVPFKYVDFYDAPRLILFTYKDQLFSLASYFDEDKDDYDENYSVELLPSWVAQKITDSSWKVLEDDIIGRKLLGKMPVNDVVFDRTRRKTLDPTFLDKYLK
jgi:hypothetical protein